MAGGAERFEWCGWLIKDIIQYEDVLCMWDDDDVVYFLERVVGCVLWRRDLLGIKCLNYFEVIFFLLIKSDVQFNRFLRTDF